MIEARKHLTPRPGVCGNWITPIITDADGEAVAIIQAPKYSQVSDPAQREAEGRELAHLFAAAPDLLAACREAIIFLSELDPILFDGKDELPELLRIAVREAEGED